jgi:hypothetical protein
MSRRGLLPGGSATFLRLQLVVTCQRRVQFMCGPQVSRHSSEEGKLKSQVDVNGPNMHPVWKFLKESKPRVYQPRPERHPRKATGRKAGNATTGNSTGTGAEEGGQVKAAAAVKARDVLADGSADITWNFNKVRGDTSHSGRLERGRHSVVGDTGRGRHSGRHSRRGGEGGGARHSEGCARRVVPVTRPSVCLPDGLPSVHCSCWP